MSLFILDTDHVTLLQRGHPRVAAQFNSTPLDEIAASIVTYEEQLRGRLAVVRHSETPVRLSAAYQRLREMHEFFCALHLLGFDEEASTIYKQLRPNHRRLGTMDLRIAATTLAFDGTLVTRNTSDFKAVPDLILEDWSIVP